ncbi:MAG: methyl-accepting chemotaxis protein [Myxococcota bacterium]|jgi:methyl-accepting chemotaxis protein|nr:methyl-accepting chemotaxis protein [Myxococcota bacterium]
MANKSNEGRDKGANIEGVIERLSAYLDEGETFAPFKVENTEDELSRLCILINELVERAETSERRQIEFEATVGADLERVYDAVNRMSSGDFSVMLQLESSQLSSLGDAFSFLSTSLKTLTEHQTRRRRETARQVQDIQFAIERMAKGHFEEAIQVDGGEEIGPIVRGLETLRLSYQDMLASLERSVAHLSSAATQFVVAARQQAHNANEQASSVNETNIAIHELAQMARESEQRTKEVIEVANRSESAYQEGHKAVEESIRGMNLLREQVESIAQTILALSEKTQAVGDIIATVKDIAEQSKLLALNASIEAARAGDHGRGFKVVASEMRSLSAQSKQATNQVRGILNEILSSANKAVLVTESGSKQAERGVDMASQAGEAMLILSEAIARSSDVAHQIAASVRQQVSGMSQMIEAIDTIHQSVQGSLDGAHQIEHSAVDLQNLAEELRTQIVKYRRVEEER